MKRRRTRGRSGGSSSIGKGWRRTLPPPHRCPHPLLSLPNTRCSRAIWTAPPIAILAIRCPGAGVLDGGLAADSLARPTYGTKAHPDCYHRARRRPGGPGPALSPALAGAGKQVVLHKSKRTAVGAVPLSCST